MLKLVHQPMAVLLLTLVVCQTVCAQTGNTDTESPLASQPQTAEEYFDAAMKVVQLARPDIAAQYVQKILDLKPTDQELIELRQKFGSGTFVELARLTELEPVVLELIDRMNEAVANTRSSSGYADSLLPKLMGSARERDSALNELRQLGAQAVPAMLKRIANPGDLDVHVLNDALPRLGSDAAPAFIGGLTSPDMNVQMACASALGLSGSKESIVWLYAPAFGEQQPQGLQEAARIAIAQILYGNRRYAPRVTSYGASRRMNADAIAHLTETYDWPLEFGDRPEVPVWSWDAAQGTIVENVVSRKIASIYFAERLAREASQISSNDDDSAVIALAAMLTRDMEAAGWDQPFPKGPGTAHDLAVEAGAFTCEKVLQLGHQHELPAVVLGAVQALSLNGSTDLLHKPESGIIQALDSPNPRVQFSAALTILQWEPTESFPQAHRVVEILGRAINSDSQAGGVVIDPNETRGSETVGMFGELGFDSKLALTGMEGFRVAAERGNIELAVVHPNTIRWELSQTIANLRADSRTRNVPVVIYGPASVRENLENLVSNYQRVYYVNEAVTAIDVNRGLRPLLAQISPPPMTQQQRSERMAEAAFWLRRIATYSTSVFDLSTIEDSLSSGMNNPAIATDCTIAMSSIGRPSVQKRLLSVATGPSVDPGQRELAGLQLGAHINRFGNLLSKEEIATLENSLAGSTESIVTSALTSALGSLSSYDAVSADTILHSPATLGPISKGQE